MVIVFTAINICLCLKRYLYLYSENLAMPKSQVQMAVVYIFSAIVVLIILGFGYMQISESRKTFSEASKLALQAKIKKGIDSMAYQFGSSKEVYYDVSD